MGGAQSDLTPVPPSFPYLSVSLRQYDKIRIVYGTANEVNLVRQAIIDTWPAGIQSEKVKFGYCYQFKVRGTPFAQSFSSEDAAAARNMACKILQSLYYSGWKCLVSSDLTRTTDLTTWILQRDNVEMSDRPFACISLSSSDKLQMVNVPAELHSVIYDQVKTYWSQGISKDKVESNNVYEIHMHGWPWRATGQESVDVRRCLQGIISALDSYSWQLYTSSNIKSTADSLFFKYTPSLAGNSFHRNFLVVSLNRTDRIRLIGGPEACVSIIRDVIVRFWREGIQGEKDYSGAHEFKLRGNPWWSSGEEGVNARYIIIKMLEALLACGWTVIDAIDISRRLNDKSILVFKQCNPQNTPFLCVSLSDVDKIRLINAPAHVLQAARQVVASKWPFGASDEKESYMGCWQWNLKEINPWADYGFSGHSGLHGRSLVLFIVEALRGMQWRLVLSADVSAKYVHQENGPDYPVDVHSLFFIHDPPQPPGDGGGEGKMATAPYAMPASATQYGVSAASTSYMQPPPSYSEVVDTSGKN